MPDFICESEWFSSTMVSTFVTRFSVWRTFGFVVAADLCGDGDEVVFGVLVSGVFGTRGCEVDRFGAGAGAGSGAVVVGTEGAGVDRAGSGVDRAGSGVGAGKAGLDAAG